MKYATINITPIPALKDNYIWLIQSNHTNECWIIDPGEALPVIKIINKHAYQLAGILITHHHHDHTGGLKELINVYGNIPIYGSSNSPCPYITHLVKEGDVISLPSTNLEVLEIPGHTLDHTAYFNNEFIFTGDTLFSAGCGKIFEGTPDMMYRSLQKILKLRDDIDIYCGHEYTLNNLEFSLHVDPTNIYAHKKLASINMQSPNTLCTLPSKLRDEKLFNPFLQCYSPTIITAVSQYAERNLTHPVEVFEWLRKWKNSGSF